VLELAPVVKPTATSDVVVSEQRRDLAPVRVGASKGTEKAEPSYQYELFATIVDRWGLPGRVQSFLVGPLGIPCHLDSTEHKGSEVHLTWSAKQPSMAIACTEFRPGSAAGLRMLTMRAGVPARIAFGSEQPTLPDSWILSAAPPAVPRMVDTVRFAVPLRNRVWGWDSIAMSGPGHFGTGRPPTGSLEGTVRDTAGNPAVNVGVFLLRPSENGMSAVASTTTDAQGHYVFRNLTGVEVQVRAGGGAEGLALTKLQLINDGACTCDLQLTLGPHVRGRIVDDTGARIDHWRIVYEGSDEPWYATTESDATGAFVVPVAHGSRGRLLCWSPVPRSPLPLCSVASVTTHHSEVIVPAVIADPEGGFRVRVPQSTPGTMGNAVMIYQESSERGAFLAGDEVGVHFTIRGLAAGWYRLVAATLTHGAVNLGRHRCDGHRMVDLGVVELPDLATVRFEVPKEVPKNDKAQLYQVRDDLDLRVDGLDLTEDSGVRLPPGKYVVYWQDADGVTQHRAFALTAGEHRTVDTRR
jgi:hypothetical protein